MLTPPMTALNNRFKPADHLDIGRLIAALRRQLKVIAACVVIALACAVAYVISATPEFTARASLLIDNERVRAVEESYALRDSNDMQSAIDSQVEILKSERIALAIIKKLDLTNDQEFMSEGATFFGTVTGTIKSLLDPANWMGGAPEPDSADKQYYMERGAVGILASHSGFTRIPRTSVIEISYSSRNPDLAARIANAYPEAYLTDQLDAKYEATRRASDWLQARIQELRQQTLEKDLAVEKFKADHNLVAADGILINEQQTQALLAAVQTARNETSAATAKYNQVQTILKNGDTTASMLDSFNNPVVNSLRERYLIAAKRVNELEPKVGPAHSAVVALRNEMAEYQNQMFAELGRLAEGYKSDLAVAQARQKTQEDAYAAALGLTTGANQDQVKLRELQREADSYRSLHQTFLERYQEAVQQQSFPITEARVITNAVRPASPSKPKKALVLILATIMGGCVGVGVGFIREMRERAFRTASQVRDELDLEVIGMLPRISEAKLRQYRPGGISPAMTYAIDQPLTSFAETLRGAKIAANLLVEKPHKVIGIVSTVPGEGKSVVAKNFASLVSQLGASTILIDCDLRHPGLTEAVLPNTELGLLDVILGEQPWQALIHREEQSGLSILPAGVRRKMSHTSELLTSKGMDRLLKEVTSAYEFVIVDLPPLRPVVDVRAFASRVDGFIFVVEWGKTPRALVAEQMRSTPEVHSKCIGALLNKVDSGQIALYENYTIAGGPNDYRHYLTDHAELRT